MNYDKWPNWHSNFSSQLENEIRFEGYSMGWFQALVFDVNTIFKNGETYYDKEKNHFIFIDDIWNNRTHYWDNEGTNWICNL